ncbi:hypothetical protein TRVA0_001S04258 [Trichomonascus vanleenenianus]|uniref:coatomer subunit epsilon n=1 Tax=Trichomonascus vanleenenianus TaxID=2268995 RepID=UPI003ECA6A21
MDPFSDSGELFSVQQAYYAGDFNRVISIDISNFSEDARVKAQVLVSRAKIQLGKAKDVISEFGQSTVPALQMTRAFAEYHTGAKEVALSAAKKLIEKHGSEDATVQYLGGVLYVLESKDEEALALLSKHQGSLECISLLVQIYLKQDQLDKAQKEVDAAKKWAQDNIVFNLAESWVDLRQGGEKAQLAYYIFEELNAGNSPTVKSLVGQSVAKFAQNHNDEGEEYINEALSLEPTNAEALANCIVSAIIAGKDYSEYESRLQKAQGDHPSLIDLQAKEKLFQKVVEKYQPQTA